VALGCPPTHGPSQYDLDRQTISHWFDGLAMLHRFGFADTQVSYTNRFLRSDAFKRAKETGRLTAGGFATDPCASLFRRVMAIFSPERPDNCNVSVNALAHQAVALPETRMPICFDAETLETLAQRRHECPLSANSGRSRESIAGAVGGRV
jgi:beta,beta-carotene 9',10'-dioxygenase